LFFFAFHQTDSEDEVWHSNRVVSVARGSTALASPFRKSSLSHQKMS
jgi:hypothetical protein